MAKMSWETYKVETEKEFKLSGKMRDFTKVTKLYEKGRLFIKGRIVTPPTFEQLRIAIRVINELYEDQWDISFKAISFGKNSKTDSNKIYPSLAFNISGIQILFESITIRNTGGGRGHLIKDLLVEIPMGIDGNQIKIDRLKGGRLTMSFAEWQSHYFHSHLDTTSNQITEAGASRFPYLKSFCTGSGEINIYQQNINGDGLNEARFTQYAMQIMALVGHESIEGHPYRRYSSISARPSSGRTYSTPNNGLLEGFYRFIINFYKENRDVPLTINIGFNTQGMYTVNEDEIYTNFITYPFTYTDSPDNYRRYWCIVGDNGTYYQYNEAPGYIEAPNFDRYKIIFRGIERVFKVESLERSQTPLTNAIHPNFVKHFKNKLEYELNKKRITESTVNRYKNQNSDARESTEANPVPVQTNS